MIKTALNSTKQRAQAGFTLLEMLVVVMIMGFLLAMIAPRFASIFGDSEDTVCDSNIKNTRQFVAGFEMAHNKLPNNLLNPVLCNAAGNTFSGVGVGDPAIDGNEAFTAAFVERITAGLYALNAAEAQELRELGVTTVLAYNNTGDAGAKIDPFAGNATLAEIGRELQEVPVAAGVRVLMIGASTNNAGAVTNQVAVNATTHAALTSGIVDGINNHIAHPWWMYRIFMGIGPNSELVTSGYAQSTGNCPSFERAVSEFTTWGHYCLVMPRLAATIERVSETDGLMREITCVASRNSTDAHARQVTIDLLDEEATETNRVGFDVFCPEGHRWPEEVETWSITAATLTS